MNAKQRRRAIRRTDRMVMAGVVRVANTMYLDWLRQLSRQQRRVKLLELLAAARTDTHTSIDATVNRMTFDQQFAAATCLENSYPIIGADKGRSFEARILEMILIPGGE